MSVNPAGSVGLPLTVFGSWVTEMSPESLPQGVSPDNQDNVFAPGTVGTRPALQRVFDTPFPSGGPSDLDPTVTFAASYITPAGVHFNLYFDSNGNFYTENIDTNPGIYTLLFTSTPGSYARALTAFGRSYIAISDGLHGQEVPLQWDGTNLDRVTQDGPAATPVIANLILPSSVMTGAIGPSSYTIISVTPIFYSGGYSTYIDISVTASLAGVIGPVPVTVAGSSNPVFDGTYTVVEVIYGGPNILRCNVYFPPGTAVGTGGTATLGASSGSTMVRSNNIVTVTTATPHNLQVGYLAQITRVGASLVSSIASITIDNEDNPGIATVTTSVAHGLVPGLDVTMTGIAGAAVGGGITAALRNGDISTITTASPHGLQIGSVVTIAGVSDNSFDGSWIVANVVDLLNFTFADVDANSTSSGGTVTLNWPIPDTSTPTYFEVVAAPTATTFQVQISYADGSWTGGNVYFAWDGTFFVLTVPTSTTFTYQQYGPNAVTTATGTVTPYGQAAPGLHQMQILFQTREGAITAPSPPVNFVANGGQYISLSNIPIGPPNVVARIIAFTGALGATFFYIPVPAQINGQVVSTSTVVMDNTSTSAILDFSDNTLFAGLGISIPGNNLANQFVLEGALGFNFYNSRLIAYGQRNTVNNLLNMGFDGGYLPSAPTLPTGWTVPNTDGQLALSNAAGSGFCWQVTVLANASAQSIVGLLQQGAYEDYLGDPIIQSNMAYLIRFRAKLSDSTITNGEINFSFTSVSDPTFSFDCILPWSSLSTNWQYFEVQFFGATATPTLTPATIPTDLLINIYESTSSGTANNQTIQIDEMNLIYADNPYLDTVQFGSYVNNPEGLDAVSGKFGPADDTRKIMANAIIRSTFYMLTEDPSGRLHEATDNGVTEPAGWTVNEIGANCGLLSAFGLCQSQADDTSAAGGEEWFAWASESGGRMFGGDQPWKISQEIQPNWYDPGSESPFQINMAAKYTIALMNDPVERVVYFALPIGSATAPNLIYPMNYRELDTPYQIAMSPPVHTSYSGRLIATDNTRKWTRWNMSMNGMARMYRTPGQLTAVFFGGNGQYPGTAEGFANVYILNPSLFTDDDYGQINSYYVTASLPSADQEQELQLDSGRKMMSYLSAFVSGIGNMTYTILCDALSNPWPLTGVRALSSNPQFDQEWGAGYAQAQRFFIQIQPSPDGTSALDNAYSLQRLNLWMKKSRMLVRGASQ